MHPVASAAADLAINGGSPVRSALLPYGRQSVDESDIAEVVKVLRSDWLTTGPEVARFENEFASAVGSEFAVSFSSGTAALHAAAHVAGLKPGDEAITSPLTFAASANCILFTGASPVLADVEAQTLNLDPAQVESRVTSRTRAIIAVDYAGHPADLDAFRRIASRHNLIFIEDAAHALGASYRGRPVGSVADMTVFSFHPVKHITTGEGGMVATGNPGFARGLREFRNHGITSDARSRQSAGEWRYEMSSLGYNYRLPDFCCALGRSQLLKLEANIARRRRIAQKYTDRLGPLGGVQCPQVSDHVEHAWHLYPIRLDLERLSAGRDHVFRALRAENIGVNVHYIPVHFHAYYRSRFGDLRGHYPVCEDAFERLISLPIFHGMTDGDVQDVMEAVEKVISAFS